MSWEAIAAFSGLGITVLAFVFGAYLKSMNKITSMEQGILHAGKIRHETIVGEIGRNRAEFAETVKAIREHADLAHRRLDHTHIKIQEVEIYLRDHYIEDSTFEASIRRVEASIKEVADKLDEIITAELERLRQQASER